MEQKEKNGKLKIVITVLAVLLALSIIALAGTLVYNRVAQSKPVSVNVPDNLITPDKEGAETSISESASSNISSVPDGNFEKTSSVSASESSLTSVSGGGKTAASIELYDKNPEENTPFNVSNMFPGDSETEYFRVRVSHSGKVTVHYHADIRSGYEKLSEVLNVRIMLLSSGETMYDGLMRDMPQSLTYSLDSKGDSTDELYYEITAYLDTSVGNEYQNKDLAADFRWWVQESENLTPPPRTGDSSFTLAFIILAAVSGLGCLLCLVLRKREDGERHE